MKKKGLAPGAYRKAIKEHLASQKDRGLSAIQQTYLATKIRNTTMIYFIRLGEDGPVKIGQAQDVYSRLEGLQTGSPYKLKLLGHMFAPPSLESKLHAYFDHIRMEGEWFKPEPEVLEFAALLAQSNLEEIIKRLEKRVAENNSAS